MSFKIPMPDQKINRATTMPNQPSTGTLEKREITSAAKATDVAAVSERLSTTTAFVAVDSMHLPSERLKNASQSFAAMDTSKIISATLLYVTGLGSRIFSIDDFKSSKPMSKIKNDTISAVMYSIRP